MTRYIIRGVKVQTKVTTSDPTVSMILQVDPRVPGTKSNPFKYCCAKENSI